MVYQVLLSETAVKYLRRLEQADRERVVKGLRSLGEDPFKGRPGTDIKPLAGTTPQKYRLRVGDYRAVYVVEGEDVKVIEVFQRGRGYR